MTNTTPLDELREVTLKLETIEKDNKISQLEIIQSNNLFSKAVKEDLDSIKTALFYIAVLLVGMFSAFSYILMLKGE